MTSDERRDDLVELPDWSSIPADGEWYYVSANLNDGQWTVYVDE